MSEALPNFTKRDSPLDLGDIEGVMLTPQQDAYVTYCAIGGIMTGEDGTIGNIAQDGTQISTKPLSTSKFAAMINVTRQTLWNWQKTIPDFWGRVAERRRVVGSQTRLTKAWNGIWLKACAGNAEAAKLYFANFDPNFRMPTEKVQHETPNSWTALMATKRNVVEGEVVDAPTTDHPGTV
jgi:hypothetical protein